MLFGYFPNSSPVPVIGLVDALVRLMDKLPVADVVGERESFDRALGLPEPDPAWAEPPAPVAALLQTSSVHWMRHEAGIKRLGDALNTGELHLSLRYEDGRLIQLTTFKWRASPYQREIMMSGQWRDEDWRPPEDRHGDCEAVLITSEFDAWCGRSSLTEEPSQPLESPPTPAPASLMEPWELIQQQIAEEPAPTQVAITPAVEPETSEPAPPPKPPPPLAPLKWLEGQIEQRESDEIPSTFANRIESVMEKAQRAREVKKAWGAGHIANQISKLGLWPK
jgi:hypothetical protein